MTEMATISVIEFTIDSHAANTLQENNLKRRNSTQDLNVLAGFSMVRAGVHGLGSEEGLELLGSRGKGPFAAKDGREKGRRTTSRPRPSKGYHGRMLRSAPLACVHTDVASLRSGCGRASQGLCRVRSQSRRSADAASAGQGCNGLRARKPVTRL